MRLNEEWRGSRFPPGCYPFTDGRTGFKFDACAGGLEHRIADVQKHRRANPTIYPPSEPEQLDSNFIQQQIEDHICGQRIELCIEAPRLEAQVMRVELPTTPCKSCGAINFAAEFCKSCGGGRVQNYKCLNCGTKL